MSIILNPKRPYEYEEQIIDLTDPTNIYSDEDIELSKKYLIDCGMSPEDAEAAITSEFDLAK